MAVPSAAELDAIEKQQATLLGHMGADVVEDPELGVTWIRFAARTPSLTFATSIRWPESEFAATLSAFENRMRSAGEWPAVSVADGVTQPIDLGSRLADLGWTRISGERIMFNRHAPVVPHLDPGLRIEAVTAASALECVQLETANFGLPPDDIGERAERLAGDVASGEIRGYIVRLVREPVASTRLVPAERVAALTGVGVVARQRRRGYGRLITAVATRAGLATGHGLVWLSVDEANTAAVELYRGLGYEPSFAWSRWIAPPV
jgi:ribosomal protein S18 acetylase RimI-like enzyme